MSQWMKIYINSNSIKGTYGNSTIIHMPQSQKEWKGCVFFHPSKLVRTVNAKSYVHSVSFTDEFEFKIYKNKRVIDTLSAEDIIDIFDNSSVRSQYQNNKKSYYKEYEPKKVENSKVSVDKELLVDDDD